MELWHGSEVVVEHPSLDKCRQFNDYGRGFYCTPHEEMAMEWACRTESDGVANRYELELDGLSVLDLESGEFSILNWLAIWPTTGSLMSRRRWHAKDFGICWTTA